MKGVSFLHALTGRIGSVSLVSEIHPPQTGEIYPPQTGAFMEILSLHSRHPSLPIKRSSKKLSLSVYGPQEVDDHPQGAPSKAGPIPILGARSPPHAANCERGINDADSSSQRIVTNTQSLLYKGQILQMLTDIKEQMKKQ